MYDRKKRAWISDATDPELLRWSALSENRDKPEAMFLMASDILSEHRSGGEAAKAVYLMETAAKAAYPPAVFAMGQMFEEGIAVHKSRRRALELYRQAADLNYEPAERALAELRRKRAAIIAASFGAAALIAVILAGGMMLFMNAGRGPRILVGSGTELTKTGSVEEYASKFRDIIAAYDSGPVIAGEESTKRVVVRYEGDKLDLRDFPAEEVLYRYDGLLLIQFASENEALRCAEALRDREGVVYAEIDGYNGLGDAATVDNGDLYPKDTSMPYYSWGVGAMGLDKLSAWVADRYPDRSLIVAVMDTGAYVGLEFRDRVVPGYNVVTGGEPLPDLHGTHTVGTVLDGTRGTGVKVMNIDVFNETDDGAVSGGGSILGRGDSAVELGVLYAVEHGAKVISISLGNPNHNPVFEDALKRAVEAGVVVCKSAGNNASDNSGTTGLSCPAELSEPIVVGAVDSNHIITDFSNYGLSVDVYAPGDKVLSQFYMYDEVLVSLPGTSMACPHVAALAALVRMSLPDATPAQVELYIKDYCDDSAYGQYDDGLHGAGEPDGTMFIEE